MLWREGAITISRSLVEFDLEQAITSLRKGQPAMPPWLDAIHDSVGQEEGKGTREAALRDAIARAQKNFELQWGISSNSLIKITPAYPHEFGGLQVVDYYLWALQRLYERNQDQFFNPLARDYRLIMDLDDKRNKVYGEWYKDSNPLSLGVIKL